MSRFPIPRYPNGWFQVAYSDELPKGGVMPLKYFGKDLVLFRTEDGEAHVLDAFCAHLGAHLGHGGKVEDGAITCPFHAWRFDGSGTCVGIPYAKKIPPKAKVAPWTVRERNGMIMVWYHAEGQPPSWEVPELPEYGSDEWTPYERRSWNIRTHNQEMAENSCDSAHFMYVHGAQEMPRTVAEPKGHVLHAVSKTLMVTPKGNVDGQVDVQAHGFGFTTNRFTGIVETLLIGTATTIDEEYVQLRFSFTLKKLGDKKITSSVGEAFMREIKRQLEQDIPIWENKRYVPRPMLADGDGPVGVFRKWARQFYSEDTSPDELESTSDGASAAAVGG